MRIIRAGKRPDHPYDFPWSHATSFCGAVVEFHESDFTVEEIGCGPLAIDAIRPLYRMADPNRVTGYCPACNTINATFRPLEPAAEVAGDG